MTVMQPPVPKNISIWTPGSTFSSVPSSTRYSTPIHIIFPGRIPMDIDGLSESSQVSIETGSLNTMALDASPNPSSSVSHPPSESCSSASHSTSPSDHTMEEVSHG